MTVAGAILFGAGPAAAASGPAASAWLPPWWSVSGFVAFLIGIAILPVVAPRFWEPNRNKAAFSLALAIPFGAYIFAANPVALAHSLHEYFQFITLLFSLYVIAGGIWLSGDLRASPRNNTLFLASGALMASIFGTTGACMLLIRPLLSSNSERTHVTHTVIFFIFLVANIGGALTPLGDPPLFLGYLRGVPFLWTLTLWKLWLPSCLVLLVAYYAMDRTMWNREPLSAQTWDSANVKPLRLRGWHNFFLLLGIIAAAFFDPAMKRLMADLGLSAGAARWVPAKEAIMLLMAWLSWKTTARHYRKAQNFSFHPIQEVAIIFFGVFVTMVPALALLHDWGPTAPLHHPWQFFWGTGLLSSFLDNAPTYLTFLTLGLGQGNPNGAAQIMVGGEAIKESTLLAISAGAVFMGANTYIGNAPNFMVKAIAESTGVKMPSFFGFLGWSVVVLFPWFLVLTLIFFT